MKISLEWLNSLLDRPVDADEADRLLTSVGFPLDGCDTRPDGDALLDVEVTSNRPDCLSHVGIAREVAAASGRTLNLPTLAPDDPAHCPTLIDNQATDLCPLYTARLIRGVRVGPSPDWLRRRLEAIGLRSVNNIVDVTNYVLHETGQPLHAFDLAKLGGGRVVVRRARAGERFTAIDQSRHALGPDMLVIADAAAPVAIAGVMGGLDSEVGPTTTDVLLESAEFDPLSVRRTSRALKLASDSSYRFERGVDPLGVEAASRRAAALMIDVAGGRVECVARVGRANPSPCAVSMRVARCAELLGRAIDPGRATAVLERLGLSATLEDDRIHCRVPTFRRDLQREIDLIEEVARHDDFDRIAVRDRLSLTVRPPQRQVVAMRTLRQVLVAHGYHETVTFSFVRPEHAAPFADAGERVEIDDARRKAEPVLRPSLLPSLLACRKTNQDAGNVAVKLFEAAATWRRDGGRIVESTRLALLADAGDDLQRAVCELRGTLEELVEALAGNDRAGFTASNQRAMASAATLTLDATVAGAFGIVDAATLKAFDLQTPVVAAELDLTALLALEPARPEVAELPRYPGIQRDLSVVVDDATPWSAIEAAARDVRPDLLESLTFVGVYRGKPIPRGRKSVTLRMTFRDPRSTLRHEQVDPQVERVLACLREAVGAELRN